MCFSASASFGASAVLAVVGVTALCKSHSLPSKIFSLIPLIFSVQQLTEGLLWRSLADHNAASWRSVLTYIYLLFAMAVWPFWIPFSIYLLEENTRRKKLISVFVGIGLIVSIGVISVLLAYPVEALNPVCPTCPSNAEPVSHLHYEFNIPSYVKNLIVLFSILYIGATIITPFLSSISRMKLLGVVFLAAYLFAIAFYQGFVISVWCFFAAALSFVVLWIILTSRQESSRV